MSPRGPSSMSGFGVPPLTRGVKWLGGVTLAVSIAAAVFGDAGQTLARALVFVPVALLGLWLLGVALEQRWGTRRFVTFYFLTSAAGALATALVALVAPSVQGF